MEHCRIFLHSIPVVRWEKGEEQKSDLRAGLCAKERGGPGHRDMPMPVKGKGHLRFRSLGGNRTESYDRHLSDNSRMWIHSVKLSSNNSVRWVSMIIPIWQLGKTEAEQKGLAQGNQKEFLAETGSEPGKSWSVAQVFGHHAAPAHHFVNSGGCIPNNNLFCYVGIPLLNSRFSAIGL